MILVNTETIPGFRITRLCGLAQGNTIRAKNIGRDIGAGFKNLVGGELRAYTELMTEARNEATQRMIAHAQQLGANAIVNVRFTTSQVAGSAAELYAYGTAVVIEQDQPGAVAPPDAERVAQAAPAPASPPEGQAPWGAPPAGPAGQQPGQQGWG